jgi:hypothetical protein
MTRSLVSSSIAFVLTCATAVAQSTLPVSVDQRVRVRTADSSHIGRVIEVTPANLRLVVDGRNPVTLAAPAITQIEESRGTSRSASARKGAIRGAIIAGVIGAISLGLQHDSVGDDGSSVGKAAALGAFSGGLFGGMIGAGIGASRPGERWVRVFP